jgi:hypothetical protein
VIMVLVQMVYVQDILGDKNTEIIENESEQASPSED